MSERDHMFIEDPELRALLNLGVNADAITRFDVLCLPENIREAGSREELVDAGDSLDLAKRLKEAGVTTATSYELVPEARTAERRGADLWLGVVWVLSSVALPLFLSVLANMLTNWRSSRVAARATVAPTVHLKLRLKRGENTVNIDYSGDGDTLIDVIEALKPTRDKRP